jgi:hypothetical protein
MFCTIKTYSQGSNTPPLPNGETVIGNYLHAHGDEVWTTQPALYFNWRGSGASTYFWNLNGGIGMPVMSILNSGRVGIGNTSPATRFHIFQSSGAWSEGFRFSLAGKTGIFCPTPMGIGL